VVAGSVKLPQAVTLMIFAPLSSVWVQRFGNKIVVATGLLLVTTSLLLFNSYQSDSSVFVVIAVTMLMGLGMANVMAPCTDSIMGSLPRAKAGVGSAVNDTTRQTGGAVGVAVFGSIMASHFTSSFAHKVNGALPSGLFAQVGNNVGQAIGTAKESPAARPFAAQISTAARDSFVSGLHLIGFVAAGVTLVAAICVVLYLPARARDEAPVEAQPEPVPISAR